jgi:signal transduction histidine kinase
MNGQGIAREIHDNVGHLLSSAIIQLGAVIMTTDNEQTKESLTVLKVTLLRA